MIPSIPLRTPPTSLAPWQAERPKYRARIIIIVMLNKSMVANNIVVVVLAVLDLLYWQPKTISQIGSNRHSHNKLICCLFFFFDFRWELALDHLSKTWPTFHCDIDGCVFSFFSLSLSLSFSIATQRVCAVRICFTFTNSSSRSIPPLPDTPFNSP